MAAFSSTFAHFLLRFVAHEALPRSVGWAENRMLGRDLSLARRRMICN